MAQNNLTIADGTGLEVRTGFNNSNQSLASLFSGNSDPSTLSPSCAFAGMLWMDTGNSLIKQRDSTNATWITKGSLDTNGTIQWYNVDGYISVKDYGAKGDNSTNDTTAIQAAFNSGAADIFIPAGTYLVNPGITIPNTVQRIHGARESTSISIHSSSTNTTSNVFSATSVNGLSLEDFSFNVNATTWSNITPISLSTCDRAKINRLTLYPGGYQPIYLYDCTNSIIENCYCNGYSQRGIRFEGASNNNISAINNTVIGVGVSAGISGQLGTNYLFSGNYVATCAVFGLNLYQVTYGTITGNTTYNTGHEGINIEDSSNCNITNNRCEWSGSGADFGISIYGNATVVQYIVISNNNISNSWSSGIALADKISYCTVIGNSILNANRGSIANISGILAYGVNNFRNVITGNIISDVTGPNSVYGINDGTNFGTGIASDNTITNNTIVGFTTAAVNRATTTVQALNSVDMDYKTYTPTVASTSGTITTVGAVSGYYLEMGKLIFLYATAAITTNGTGAGAVNISLPITGNRGMMSGKEDALTGKTLTAEVSGSNATCRIYDNTYPGGNGAILIISGFYER